MSELQYDRLLTADRCNIFDVGLSKRIEFIESDKMMAQTYQLLIVEGIRDLPTETLAEIIDFIYFVRKRTLEHHQFEEEVKQLSRAEITHLEMEFEGYEQRYPHE
jgi:hypothetical protein